MLARIGWGRVMTESVSLKAIGRETAAAVTTTTVGIAIGTAISIGTATVTATVASLARVRRAASYTSGKPA